MDLPFLLAGVAAAGIFLLFLGLIRVATADVVDVDSRLKQYSGRSQQQAAAPSDEQQSALVAGMERALSGRTFASNLQRELSRADMKLTVSEFYILQGVAVVLGAILLGLIAQTPLGGVGGAVLGFFLPKWYIGFRQGGRIKAFNNQLGDTITLLANSLKSGYSLLQSMEMAAREAAPPTSTEFQRVVREVGLGLSTEEALSNLLRRVPSADLDLMITAINVQMEVGGNLALILETIGFTIRERVRIKGEIGVLTAQAQISGYVISLLPVGLAGVLFLLNRSYMMNLFTPGVFLCMPICAGLGITVGFFAMQAVMKIDV